MAKTADITLPTVSSSQNDVKTVSSFDENDTRENNTFPMTKFQILRNVCIVSFGFLLLFTSFGSLSNLQSSLNREDGLGTGGLAIIYGALVVSCMFLPSFVISKLGCKWTVAFSMLCYIGYMAANFYAVWGLIAPAAVILGLGAAPLWSAKCTYLTQTGVWYSKMTGTTEDDIVNRFFGFFFMVFQTSQIWGNLISSLVFGEDNGNSTVGNSSEALASCGVYYCPTSDANNTNFDKPDLDKIYTVCGIYIACGCLAFIIIAVFLDKITLDKEAESKNEPKQKLDFRMFIATFKHLWKSDYQKLMIVITIYSGVEQAFITGDFTRSYVSCALGISNVGYVMICYGVTDAICSFTFGRMVQYVGHIPFFILAFLLHGGLQITLLLWEPDPTKEYLFYIFAAIWGMGDAVIQTQLNAFYGTLFPGESEAAFANYRLWESVGFIITFAYSDFICTDAKLYVCITVLTVGIILYGATEVLYRKNSVNPM
ncbi:hypothetical protein ScPMuIL_001125 [Solemya velum]